MPPNKWDSGETMLKSLLARHRCCCAAGRRGVRPRPERRSRRSCRHAAYEQSTTGTTDWARARRKKLAKRLTKQLKARQPAKPTTPAGPRQRRNAKSALRRNSPWAKTRAGSFHVWPPFAAGACAHAGDHRRRVDGRDDQIPLQTNHVLLVALAAICLARCSRLASGGVPDARHHREMWRAHGLARLRHRRLRGDLLLGAEGSCRWPRR
jgi:hypothetical protein